MDVFNWALIHEIRKFCNSEMSLATLTQGSSYHSFHSLRPIDAYMRQ